MFQRIVLLAVVLGGYGCKSSIDDVCAKAAECFLKDCDYSDAACSKLADGEQAECVAGGDAFVDAVRTGDDPSCETCVDSYFKYQECKGAIDSCSAFEDANDSDGDCKDEWDDFNDDCDDVEKDCFK